MIVAVSTSKWGGRCTECKSEILRGAPVFKVPLEGKTTQHGQGPGRWVGSCCKPLHMVGMMDKDEPEDEGEAQGQWTLND